MQVKTLAVYSKVLNAAEVPKEIAARQPQEWRLSQHQVETYRALIEGDAQVIFNTALTGDGKSLAGQLPLLIHDDGTHALMAMYPTNELIRDQQGQLSSSLEQWNSQITFGMLNSTELDQIDAEGIYSYRGDALLEILQGNDAVLTNPDIFHLVMHQFYVRRGPQGDAPDKILGPLTQKFSQFVFDEFHIFETPQIVSILNALLLIHETESMARPHKFLFLSATPRDLMLEYLKHSGLSVKVIDGSYAHGTQPAASADWRRILHNATIHFETGRVEEWVDEHLEDTLLPFFLERGAHAKGAIIVNSVAAAYRLLARLRPVFDQHGLKVAPNTGMTSHAQRKVSYAADLLIGTSTVDVGVDFQINFLLFESRDAGSFLQRLGRLGRHDGYVRNGHYHAFEDFVAYAVVPPWIQEALFQGRDGASPLLEDGTTIERTDLNDAIEKAYPPAATFERYAQRWGKLQTVHIIRGLSNPTIKEQYADSRTALGKRYETTFGISIRQAFGEYMDLYKNQQILWDEAIAFRGGSYFPCGVIDDMEGGLPKTADLFQLAANAQLTPLTEETFFAAVARAGLARRAFEYTKPLAFFRLRGWRTERENYRLVLDQDIGDWSGERFEQATLLTHWRLDADVPELNALNNRLSRRKLPCLLCKGIHPLELKRRLRLPLLFAVYGFASRDGLEGTVGFGREALLLDTRLSHYSSGKNQGSVIL